MRPARSRQARFLAGVLVVGLSGMSLAQGRLKLAVMPLVGAHLSQEVTSGLMDVIVAEVSKTGRYDLVAPQDTTVRLQQLKEELKYDPQTEMTQQVGTIGKALGAGLILHGRVSRVGNQWVVNLHVTNADSVRTVASAVREVTGKEDVLLAATREAAVELMEQVYKALQTPALLTVDATPRAEVIVNGEGLGSTPLVRRPVPPGPAEITLVASGYHPQTKKVALDAGQEVQWSVQLDPTSELIHERQAKRTWWSVSAWSGVAAAAVAVGVGLWGKSQSDQAYGRYEASVGPGALKQWDDMQRWQQIAGAGWIGAGAGLTWCGLSVYVMPAVPAVRPGAGEVSPPLRDAAAGSPLRVLATYPW